MVDRGGPLFTAELARLVFIHHNEWLEAANTGLAVASGCGQDVYDFVLQLRTDFCQEFFQIKALFPSAYDKNPGYDKEKRDKEQAARIAARDAEDSSEDDAKKAVPKKAAPSKDASKKPKKKAEDEGEDDWGDYAAYNAAKADFIRRTGIPKRRRAEVEGQDEGEDEGEVVRSKKPPKKKRAEGEGQDEGEDEDRARSFSSDAEGRVLRDLRELQLELFEKSKTHAEMLAGAFQDTVQGTKVAVAELLQKKDAAFLCLANERDTVQKDATLAASVSAATIVRLETELAKSKDLLKHVKGLLKIAHDPTKRNSCVETSKYACEMFLQAAHPEDAKEISGYFEDLEEEKKEKKKKKHSVREPECGESAQV